VEEAAGIIETFKGKNICILKGRIKASNTKLYGLFLTALNIFDATIQERICVLSSNIWMAHYDTDASWEEFLKNIRALCQRKKEIAKHATSKLRRYFMEQRQELVQLLLQEADLKQKITEDLRILFDDPSLELSLSVDRISSLPAIEEERKIEEPQIKLKVALVLSPVSGRPLWQLAKMDKVLVRVVDQTPLGQYLAELMGARKEGKLVPIAVDVEDVFPEGEEKLKVITRFGPGVVGEAVAAKNLKVFEALQRPKKTTPLHFIKEPLPSLQTRSIDYIIIVLMVVILLLIMLK
jgi:hypothetical protein